MLLSNEFVLGLRLLKEENRRWDLVDNNFTVL